MNCKFVLQPSRLCLPGLPTAHVLIQESGFQCAEVTELLMVTLVLSDATTSVTTTVSHLIKIQIIYTVQ